LLALALSASVAAASLPPVTRDHAAAVAGAINLRRGDLAGYTETRVRVTAQGLRFRIQMAKCAREPLPSELLADVYAPTFHGPGVGGSPEVGDGTEIWPSAALAGRVAADVSASRRISCFDKLYGAQLRLKLPKGVTVTVTGAALPPIVPGTYAARLTLVLHGPQEPAVFAPLERAARVSQAFYIDQFGFSDGQAYVGIYVTTPLVPPRLPLEQKVMKLLLARARATLP
jgi:hypothetical protein